MSLADWLAETRDRFAEHGPRQAVRLSAAELALGAARRVPVVGPLDDGRSIWDDEWDVCVILDACRADLYEEYAGGPVETDYSVASSSIEFHERTFDRASADEMARTALVTGNPFSATAGDLEQFAALDEVWRDRWDEEWGTVPASAVVDRGIEAWRARRRGGYDRVIVWLMQPHHPFVEPIGDPLDREQWGDADGLTPWERLAMGSVGYDEVWTRYGETLAYAMDHVDRLLTAIDAEVLITADHGNAMGEAFLYGHPEGVPHPAIRAVPWVHRTAESRSIAEIAAGTGDG